GALFRAGRYRSSCDDLNDARRRGAAGRARPSAASWSRRNKRPRRLSEWFHLSELLPAASGIMVQPSERRPNVRLNVLGNEPRHARGLRTSDTEQPSETYQPETTYLTATCSCEACSAFTRVAARTRAPSPICDQLHRKLQPFRHLHDCSGCFRLERSPGGACTHWKAPPCHGARK